MSQESAGESSSFSLSLFLITRFHYNSLELLKSLIGLLKKFSRYSVHARKSLPKLSIPKCRLNNSPPPSDPTLSHSSSTFPTVHPFSPSVPPPHLTSHHVFEPIQTPNRSKPRNLHFPRNPFLVLTRPEPFNPILNLVRTRPI